MSVEPFLRDLDGLAVLGTPGQFVEHVMTDGLLPLDGRPETSLGRDGTCHLRRWRRPSRILDSFFYASQGSGYGLRRVESRLGTRRQPISRVNRCVDA